MSAKNRAVITGANRGLGLEFTRQWLARGGSAFALVRDVASTSDLSELQDEADDRLRILGCDVADATSIVDTAGEIMDLEDGIELLINNAGARGERGDLESLDIDAILSTIEINALAPLRLTRVLLPALRAGGGAPPRVVHISSLMGSIEDNRSGGSYAYRISKAALNMVCRTMAHDLAADGIVTVALHPGWVATRMGGPEGPLSAQEAVREMLATIDTLTAEASGRFLDRNGEPLPY